MSKEVLQLHFEEFGSSNAKPLVVLHGFFASARNWRLIAKKLAEHFHVYVPDMRNHGSSPHSEIMDYPSMKADVKAFLVQHKINRPYVLGHSMGGKVAMWLALNEPGLIEKPVIVDIAPVSYLHSFDNIIQALMALPLEEITNRKQAEAALSESLPDLSFRQFLLQNLTLINGQYGWRINLNIFKHSAPAITAFPDCTALTPYSEECLFVVGGKSKHVEKQHFANIKAVFPEALIEVLPDSGHWLHAEQPEKFLAIVIQNINGKTKFTKS